MRREDSDRLYSRIENLILTRKTNVSHVINAAVIFLYWEIGETICESLLRHTRAEYGRSIVDDVSAKLMLEYGKGFNRTAVFRMIKFYQEFPDREKVATLSQQLTWSHFVELLPIEDELKRDFYAAMCRSENWSVRTLRERKSSMLYERTSISRKPEETIRSDIVQLMDRDRMSLDLFYRDPYVLDFLGLRDTFSEKDLEQAILDELEKFILEMGSDFAFLARQKHFVLDGRDYYIDLLFYHRSLRRLVLIELKLGAFEPENKGQVELYLRWLKKYEMRDGEDEPIALILCAEKSQETVELMELNQGSIHVAQYLTKLPPKKLLEEKLARAISMAREQARS
ncbi:MAG: DUF1016 family protein [Clostridia bacterium]|nr:DUF1016 family protein [Clostridia bacterium]